MNRTAHRQTPPMVERVPYFGKKLKEAAPRKGVPIDQQYAVLKTHADKLWLRALLAVAYTYGFPSDELLSLCVWQN